jgi:hypothetical protein
MYQFKEELNTEIFFKFDKMNIRNKRWSRLPKASKSILPVIAVYCNSKGIAFPSEETIAILSGRTPKTVRAGIKGLLHYPGFTKDRYLTSRGHRANKYRLNIPAKERGRIFAFHKCIVDGGNWLKLRPGAHALYIVIRTFAFFDCEEYCGREDLEYGYDLQEMIESGYFQDRKYDFCDADIEAMAEYAGIGISTASRALVDLERAYLVEKIESINGNDTWKVFIIPAKRYKADELNGEVSKRFGKRL